MIYTKEMSHTQKKKELRRDGDVPVSVSISVLIKHENILLNGDVPRRNGNVTYSVNWP